MAVSEAIRARPADARAERYRQAEHALWEHRFLGEAEAPQ